jgi:hypothetical protein
LNGDAWPTATLGRGYRLHDRTINWCPNADGPIGRLDNVGVTSDFEGEYRAEQERRHAAVMALPTVPLVHRATLVPARDGDVLVSACVGPDGEVVALWSDAGGAAALTARTTQPGWASFAEARTGGPTPARVTVHGGSGRSRVVDIPDLALAHVTVQPLPHGRVLIVGARCHRRPEGPERNAVVYDADGRVELEQTLGDGIEHVLTTGSGAIWVGYFDEGVFGNYGWGTPLGAEPVGAPGLIRFAPDLQVDWRFPFDGHPWDAISDCYALNVDGEIAWTCYYTDFPVVRVDGDTLTGWHNPLGTAPKALVVGDRTVGLYGGYGEDRHRMVVAGLGDGTLTATGEYRIVLPDGSPPPPARIVGRGPDLHLLAGEQWYRLSLTDLPPR